MAAREVLAQVLAEGDFDLHMHSCVSDGSFSAEELIASAKEMGLKTIAITNHDTTEGLDEAIQSGLRAGVNVIGGVEISAWDPIRNRKVHVLGFGLKSDSPAVTELCRATLEARRCFGLWACEQLVAHEFDLDELRLEELVSGSTTIYKQHIMACLTPKPFTSRSYQGLYRSIFKGDGFCAGDIEYVDARDAVCAIVADGGAAVLAHPGQLDSYDFVPDLVEAGLEGLEKYHPDHSPWDWKLCDDLAQRYELLCTGGSDFHGAFGKIPHLGFGLPK